MIEIQDLITVHNEQEQKKVPIELEAERLLWYKVILRAVYDYVLYKNSKNKKLREEYGKNAEKWLFEVDSSLNDICDILDLSVESVRTLAKTLPRSKIVKIEFLNRGVKKCKPQN